MPNVLSGRRLSALSAVVAVLAATQVLFAPTALAQGYVPISGSGSTWSFNALDQWRRNVEKLNGIRVNFSPNGSSQGRNEFRVGTADFAVSEIEYGLFDGGVRDVPPDKRGFAYMPIVAGGTAFMYNLKIGNQRVTNLRLSGEVITKIFSQQITNWSDPAIKADNPGLTLPARPIVPVVRSDGSGTTAQFTRWMAAKHGPIWDAYCGRPNCGFTSNFPLKPGVIGSSGSNGVTQSVTAGSGEGAITYVEYSYARSAKFPVVKVLNEAGYYIEPKASNVAVGLTAAQIRDDLTQDLGGVYNNGDKRSYPLSSYSYMILPTDTRQNFNEQKGRTLSDFAYYFLCEGQQQAEVLGYSPLPVNLVQAGVKQAARIPGTTSKLTEANLQGCNNPTFSPDGTNLLATTAPQPEECDRRGAAQCTTGTGGALAPTNTGGNNAGGNSAGGNSAGGNSSGGNSAGGNSAGGNSSGGNSSGGNSAGGNSSGGNSAGGNSAGGGDTTTAAIDPETGELRGAEGQSGLASNVSAIPVSVDLPDDRHRTLLAVLAVILLVALVLGPPLVARNLSQRGKS